MWVRTIKHNRITIVYGHWNTDEDEEEDEKLEKKPNIIIKLRIRTR